MIITGLIIFIIATLTVLVYSIFQKRKNRILREKSMANIEMERVLLQRQMKHEREAEYKELTSKYGEFIPPYHRYQIYVFEKHSMVILNGDKLNYSDIIDVRLIDKSTDEIITETTGTIQSSTGDIIGRAIVGGMIGGDAGAIIGGTTGTRDIETTTVSQVVKNHSYQVSVNVNNLRKPTYTAYSGDNIDVANDIFNLFQTIIHVSKIN